MNYGIFLVHLQIETQLSGLSAGHKIWNTLPRVRRPIYASQIDPPLGREDPVGQGEGSR